MAPPSIPVPSRRRRLATLGSTVMLAALGAVFDIAALINVPGAAVLGAGVTGQARVTGLGTGLAFLVIAAWISVRWRASRPVIVLAAGGLLAVLGTSYVLLLIGAGAVVRRHPDRARPIAVAASTVVVLFALREALTSWGAALPWYFTTRVGAQYEPAWIAGSFIWAVVSLGLAAGAVLYSQARRRAAQSDVRAAEEHRRADALTEQMVRQAERERIARDMHDALAHRLSVVSLHAGALEAAAGAGQGVERGAGEIARTVREQTHAALQDMRGLIGDLRGGEPAPAPSPASLRSIAALIGDLRAGGASVLPFVFIEAPERASAMLDSAVFRILQEALTNAIKHAPGASVDVFVQVGPQAGARIRVVNPVPSPGIGAASGDEVSAAHVPGGGNGTLGIRERVAALGGTAWIGEHEGSFILDVTLPWHERAALPLEDSAA